MYLTKQQLQRIIQEEVERLSEQTPKYSKEDYYAARQMMQAQEGGLGSRRGESRSRQYQSQKRGGGSDFAHRGGGSWGTYRGLGMQAAGESTNVPLTKKEQGWMDKVTALKKSDPEKYKALSAKGLGRRVYDDAHVEDTTTDLSSQRNRKGTGAGSSAAGDFTSSGRQQIRHRFKDEPYVPREQWKPVEGDWQGQRVTRGPGGEEAVEEYTHPGASTKKFGDAPLSMERGAHKAISDAKDLETADFSKFDAPKIKPKPAAPPPSTVPVAPMRESFLHQIIQEELKAVLTGKI